MELWWLPAEAGTFPGFNGYGGGADGDAAGSAACVNCDS